MGPNQEIRFRELGAIAPNTGELQDLRPEGRNCEIPWLAFESHAGRKLADLSRVLAPAQEEAAAA